MVGVAGVFECELIEDLLTCFCRAEAAGCEIVYGALERVLEIEEGLWKRLVWNEVCAPDGIAGGG